MKRIACLIGCSLLLATSANAAETSANVSIATDYAFRGISQTNENPTIQGGFDLAMDSGLYVGIWGANVAFDGSIEVDFYAGYTASINDLVSYDVGVIRYEYPDDEQPGAPVCDSAPDTDKLCESSFTEWHLSLDVAEALSIGFNYSTDFFFNSGQATYIHATYSLALPSEYGLEFHFGIQHVDDNIRFGLENYTDYSITLSKSAMGLDFSLNWYDTDLSKNECFGGASLCEARVVLGIGKTL